MKFKIKRGSKRKPKHKSEIDITINIIRNSINQYQQNIEYLKSIDEETNYLEKALDRENTELEKLEKKYPEHFI